MDFDSEWIKNNNNGNKQQNGLDADAKWRAEMEASIARDYADHSSVQVYERKTNFLIKFQQKQNEYIKHFDRCFIGKALRLTDVAHTNCYSVAKNTTV